MPESTQTILSVDKEQDKSQGELIHLWASQEQDVHKLQLESKDLQPMLHWLEEGRLPDCDKEARRIILLSEHFQIVDGILYHLHHRRTKRLNEVKPLIQQLCIPDVLREDLLVAYHDNNAHIGRKRLYDTLKQKYYFPQMYTMRMANSANESLHRSVGYGIY